MYSIRVAKQRLIASQLHRTCPRVELLCTDNSGPDDDTIEAAGRHCLRCLHAAHTLIEARDFTILIELATWRPDEYAWWLVS